MEGEEDEDDEDDIDEGGEGDIEEMEVVEGGVVEGADEDDIDMVDLVVDANEIENVDDAEFQYPPPRPRRHDRLGNNRGQNRRGRVVRNYRVRRNYGQLNRPRGGNRGNRARGGIRIRGGNRQQGVRMPRGRRVHHPQRYRFVWETHRNKRLWLRSCRNDEFRARCILCRRRFQSYLGTIEGHARSRRHLHLLAEHEAAGSPPLVDEEATPELTMEQFEWEQARIKLILTLFFAGCFLPFRLIDRLLPLIRLIAEHYNVLRSVTLSRTMMSNIVRNVVAPVYHEEILQIILNQSFTLMFDESTDTSHKKHGIVTFKFFSETFRRSVCAIWRIFQIYSEDNEASDATAESLFNLIMQTFNVNEEDLERIRRNLNCFMSDGAATMVGIHNSVSSRFRNWCPGIITLICICHKIHLCSTTAITQLPLDIQRLASDIYTVFSRSASMQHTLSHHQINSNMTVKQVLRPAPERWLTTGPALRVIDENWDPIVATLRDHGHVQLLARLENQVTRCYVKFLNFIVPVLENMNGFFQSEESLFPEVYLRIVEDFEDILHCFVNDQHLEQVGVLNINLQAPDIFKNSEELVIGDDARALCETLPVDIKNDFLINCFRYYLVLGREMQVRLENYWRPYRICEALLQRNALSHQYREQNPNVIRLLAALFPRLIHGNTNEEKNAFITVLENQYENLLDYPFQNFNHVSRTDGFWHQIRDIVEEDGERPFEVLGTFCLNISSMPHSNAESERGFSRERLTKPRLRSNLHVETLDALMSAISCLDLQDCRDAITEFQLNEEMIRRIMARAYNPPRRNNANADENGMVQVMEELLVQFNPQLIDGIMAPDLNQDVGEAGVRQIEHENGDEIMIVAEEDLQEEEY